MNLPVCKLKILRNLKAILMQRFCKNIRNDCNSKYNKILINLQASDENVKFCAYKKSADFKHSADFLRYSTNLYLRERNAAFSGEVKTLDVVVDIFYSSKSNSVPKLVITNSDSLGTEKLLIIETPNSCMNCLSSKSIV